MSDQGSELLLTGKDKDLGTPRNESPNILAELKKQINQEEEAKEVSTFENEGKLIDTSNDKNMQIEEEN